MQLVAPARQGARSLVGRHVPARVSCACSRAR